MSRSDAIRYAHRHAFPNGNDHRHVHRHDDKHAEADVNEAHPQPFYFLCVDCEPERVQAHAIREALAESDR